MLKLNFLLIIAKIIDPIAPKEDASVAVVMPDIIDPSTISIKNIGENRDITTSFKLNFFCILYFGIKSNLKLEIYNIYNMGVILIIIIIIILAT